MLKLLIEEEADWNEGSDKFFISSKEGRHNKGVSGHAEFGLTRVRISRDTSLEGPANIRET